ncbi:MAG: hypothetical protein WC247_12255 [Porticoccaceae bacterium]
MRKFNVTTTATGLNGETLTVSATVEMVDATEYGIDWHILPESLVCSDGESLSIEDLEEFGGNFDYTIRQRLLLEADYLLGEGA